MNWLSSWLPKSHPPTSSSTHTHPQSQITQFCCSEICKYDRTVCPACVDLHKDHTLLEYKKYKRMEANVAKEIKCREGIQDIFIQFHQHLVNSLEAILANQANKFLEDIDKKIYGKNFVDIYKRHRANKTYYSYIPEFQPSLAEDVQQYLQKTIKEKELKITELFKHFIAENRILMDQYLLIGMPNIPNNPNQTKIEKVKALMPFACQLTPKFQASKNMFQTDKIHKLGIRGPILLVAQSYKGKIFGGFSPKMFPKGQHYQQDNRCRSFLFSLDHCLRLPIKEEYKKFAIKGGTNLWFGRGDLVIADECNKGNISWAQIGRAYQVPAGVNGNLDEWLGGALYFQIVEYVIYEVESTFGR